VKPFLAIAVAAALVIGCERHESAAAPAPEEKPLDDAAERSSVLELAHGSTVIDRTGEIMLELSALCAIDGDRGSFWMNPPHDLPHSMAIALPGRSRIDRVGIRTSGRGAFTANHVTFESSLDGRTFTPVTTIKSANSSEAQWFDVKPFDASTVRVTINDPLLAGHDVRLDSVLARGAELEPPHPGDITGCWSINGEAARFERHGARVIGILQTRKEPMLFHGGFDGRVYRLNWIRGNDYGMSLMTVAPDGQYLSGMNWHEEAIPMFFDISWFGQRQPCAVAISPVDIPIALLRRTGRFSLYDDGDLPRLLKSVPNAVLVAHEFRLPTAKQNRAAAERAVADLRRRFQLPNGIKSLALGSDEPRQQPVTDVMRALYSTVDLEIRR